jgi:hypothetical protein
MAADREIDDASAPWHAAFRRTMVHRLEPVLGSEDARARAYVAVVMEYLLDDGFCVSVSAGPGKAPSKASPLTSEQLDRTWTAGSGLSMVLDVGRSSWSTDRAFAAWLRADTPALVPLLEAGEPLDPLQEDEVDESGAYERLWHYVVRPAVEEVRDRLGSDRAPVWLVWHFSGGSGGWDIAWNVAHNDAASVDDLIEHFREHANPEPPRDPASLT